MNESERSRGATQRNRISSREELEQLRDILLTPEKEQIAGLRERLDNPEIHAEHVSRVLPAAVHLSSKRGGELSDALTPAVETALKDSVRRNPAVLIEAIFPIIGPAIRRAIAEALAGLLQSLNQTLEHTLSPQSFKWRLEAKRTGKSFAEVVLSRTLIYRVEQVFLIHKETGLLLQHVRRLDGSESNADLVSGMFTAIQDFARDSLGVTAGETLETMQVGDLTVWLDSSPHVMLAAVIRGVAPQDFRSVLQKALEQIHREKRELLESFAGDAEPFASTRSCLEDCLRAQAAQQAKGKKSSLGRWVVLGIFLALGIWTFVAAQRNAHFAEQERLRAAEQARLRAVAVAAEQTRQQTEDALWTNFSNKLRSEEGIVVTEAAKRDGKFHVAGLRDPLSVDPDKLLTEAHADPTQVVMHWDGYYSLSPGIVMRRATRQLQPPQSVTLQLRDDVLVASGSASAAWIASTRRIAGYLPGVARLDESGLRDETAMALSAKKDEVEKTQIDFDDGVVIRSGQDAILAQLTRQIADLRSMASATGGAVTITAIGHTSGKGTAAYNAKLGKDRAETVVALLKARMPDFSGFAAISAGGSEPGGVDATANRRVSLRVTLDPAIPGAPPL